jgi:hypothetical protein
MSDIRIRCPKCEWQPAKEDKWRCSCGNSWNVFDTAGRCPECKKVWKDTQCLDDPCHKWSPHVDWYDGLDEIIQKLIEEIEESWLAVEEEKKRDYGIQKK